MSDLDIYFPPPTGGRNADDMGMPTPTHGTAYTCGHCGYTGTCYGTPTNKGVSAPWCARCGVNNKLTVSNLKLRGSEAVPLE